jgi:hypothetical protein
VVYSNAGMIDNVAKKDKTALEIPKADATAYNTSWVSFSQATCSPPYPGVRRVDVLKDPTFYAPAFLKNQGLTPKCRSKASHVFQSGVACRLESKNIREIPLF